ncbi:MAG: type I-E CRISPR-associated protein Cse2/CasB [Syntrophales bacterium]|jgi:CRISPR system Cascade subunit CasB
MTESREIRLFEEGHPASDLMLEWRDGLKENKGDRAELRRCKNLEEIQMSSAYQRCYWQLIKHFPLEQRSPSREQMATVIGLAAHIEEDDAQRKDDQSDGQAHDFFAYQISRGDKPKLSEMRFRQLLRIRDRARLYRFFIQVIRILERKVSVLDLLSIAYYWGDSAKTNLSYKYYEKANLEK